MEHFKFLGTSLTNQNSIHEEIKCKLHSGNACYFLVQNLLSSCLLSKNIKVQVYRTIILPFVLYGCDSWSPTVSEEHRLRVFRNRVVRKIFGPMRDEVTGSREDDMMRHFMIYSPNIWVIKSRRMWWVGYTAHMGKRRCAYRILVGRPEGRRPLGRPRLRWWDINP